MVNRPNFIPRLPRRFIHHLLRGVHIARFYGGKVLRVAFLITLTRGHPFIRVPVQAVPDNPFDAGALGFQAGH